MTQHVQATRLDGSAYLAGLIGGIVVGAVLFLATYGVVVWQR
jgi:hypothetical protein